MTNSAESFRELENICKADPRWEGFVRVSESGPKQKTLEDHHARLAEIRLVEGVPEAVAIQFETARNLSLYSWFVYRFGPVAVMHAFTTLELALRECFGISREKADEKKLGLKKLLNRAIQEGKVREHHFTAVQRLAQSRARDRVFREQIAAADKAGLNTVQWDDDGVVVQPEDYPGDYLDKLLEAVPGIRNHIAHGSTMVDNSSPSLLETVSEIINQLFEKPVR